MSHFHKQVTSLLVLSVTGIFAAGCAADAGDEVQYDGVEATDEAAEALATGTVSLPVNRNYKFRIFGTFGGFTYCLDQNGADSSRGPILFPCGNQGNQLWYTRDSASSWFDLRANTAYGSVSVPMLTYTGVGNRATVTQRPSTGPSANQGLKVDYDTTSGGTQYWLIRSSLNPNACLTRSSSFSGQGGTTAYYLTWTACASDQFHRWALLDQNSNPL